MFCVHLPGHFTTVSNHRKFSEYSDYFNQFNHNLKIKIHMSQLVVVAPCANTHTPSTHEVLQRRERA